MPVTFRLDHPPYESSPWDGLAIARWLARKGCDIRAQRADGTTLLHNAVVSGDVELLRYLLDQGVRDSPVGSLRTLEDALDEDLVLLLLNSRGPPSDRELEAEFRFYAQQKHWLRVGKWLKAHSQ
jgi:hypothetical protein